jgi:hypothetical protein
MSLQDTGRTLQVNSGIVSQDTLEIMRPKHRRDLKAVNSLRGLISRPVLYLFLSQCHYKIMNGNCKVIQVKLA